MMSFERRLGTGIPDHFLGNDFEVLRGDAFLDHFCQLLQDFVHQQPAAAHLLEFCRTFPDNHLLLAATTAANTAGTWREALIVTHNQLRLYLIDCIHWYANYDQQRRAAEKEVSSQAIQQPAREMLVDPVSDPRRTLQLDAGDHDLRNQRQNRQ